MESVPGTEVHSWAICSPTIGTLTQSLPDQQLLDGLRQARGQGRDDFPVAVPWGVFVFTIALRHPSFVCCIEELNRDPALYRLLGIGCVEGIPNDYTLSRFADVLGREPHLSRLRKVFDTQVERLGRVVPDLGQHTAGDSAALCGRAKKDAGAVAAEVAQGLPQPCGGRKGYKDAEGKVTKVVERNGYKHHLLVDVKHQVPLAYTITDPAVGDNEQTQTLLRQATAKRRFPPIPRAIKTFEEQYKGRTAVQRVNARHRARPGRVRQQLGTRRAEG